MSTIALVNPQLLINNIAIPFVPNSLKFDLGLGEQSVKSVAGGAGTVDTVYFENVETKIGKITFEMFTTAIAITVHQDWKALGNANVIELVASNINTSITFQFMAQINRVEFEVGNDKMVSFEFEGNPAIST